GRDAGVGARQRRRRRRAGPAVGAGVGRRDGAPGARRAGALRRDLLERAGPPPLRVPQALLRGPLGGAARLAAPDRRAHLRRAGARGPVGHPRDVTAFGAYAVGRVTSWK